MGEKLQVMNTLKNERSTETQLLHMTLGKVCETVNKAVEKNSFALTEITRLRERYTSMHQAIGFWSEKFHGFTEGLTACTVKVSTAWEAIGQLRGENQTNNERLENLEKQLHALQGAISLQ